MTDLSNLPAEDGAGRYTVVYQGNPAGIRILNGESAVGRAIAIGTGDRISRCVAAESRAAAAEAEVARLTAELALARKNEQFAADYKEEVVRQAGVLKAEVERLTRERDEARSLVEDWKATAAAEAEVGNERQASASALRERVKVLEEALNPFTAEGASGVYIFPGLNGREIIVQMPAAFDAARAALTEGDK